MGCALLTYGIFGSDVLLSSALCVPSGSRSSLYSVVFRVVCLLAFPPGIVFWSTRSTPSRHQKIAGEQEIATNNPTSVMRIACMTS